MHNKTTRVVDLLALLLLQVVLALTAYDGSSPSGSSLGESAPAEVATTRATAQVTTSAEPTPPPVTITDLYDNRVLQPAPVSGLKADWGFSCLVEGYKDTLLFDTGADGRMLMANIESLGVDPLDIDAVVLSHPGVVDMADAATDLAGRPLAAVIGGLHLHKASVQNTAAAIAELQALGVERFGPAHCTGDPAIALFEQVFGPGFIPMGVGAVVRF